MDTHKKISLLSDNSEVLSEDQSAKVYSDYFASVYSEPVQSGAYVANVVNEVDNDLVEVIVTEGIVLQQLELLSESKSRARTTSTLNSYGNIRNIFPSHYLFFLHLVSSWDITQQLENSKCNTHLQKRLKIQRSEL